jgi:hypothetical protein
MRTAHLLFGVLGLVAISAAGCSSSTKDCTAKGCYSTSALTSDRTFTEAELASNKVTVCRAKVCASGDIVVPTSGSGTITLKGTLVSQYTKASVTIKPGGDAGTFILSAAIEWDADVELKNDDVYSLRVEDSEGTVAFEGTGSAKFQEVYPNGPGCNPYCQVVEVALK